MAQEIFQRAERNSKSETWEDLYKKDLLEVGLMVSHYQLHQMDRSPYLEALLRRGLKRKENRETANPILEEAMIFTSMVGVEMMEDVVNTNKRVDSLSLEMSESVAKVHTSINKVD